MGERRGVAACGASSQSSTAEVDGELHHAGIGGGAGDAAEGGGAEAAVWLSEGGCVGYVEQLCAKFEAGFVEQGGVLYEGQVEVTVGWSAHWVARCGADGELGSGCEGC